MWERRRGWDPAEVFQVLGFVGTLLQGSLSGQVFLGGVSCLMDSLSCVVIDCPPNLGLRTI